MKIAFTSTGTTWNSLMDDRFGRAELFVLYDDEKDEISYFNNAKNQNSGHGAGSNTARKLIELNTDILVTGDGPGGNASFVLGKTDIRIYTGAGGMSVKEAYAALKNDTLKKYDVK